MDEKKAEVHPPKRFRSLANAVYRRIPAHLRRVASPAISCFSLHRRARVECWIAAGLEQRSRLPLSILITASDLNRHYLLELIFGTSFRERYLGRVWLWNLSKAVAKAAPNCSMILAEVRAHHLKLLRSRNWFFIPGWLMGEVDLPREARVMQCSSVKSDLQRIRKHELQYEVTQDLQRFDDFYRNMHVPYITKIYRGSAYVTRYEDLEKQMQNCELLLVKKEEAYLGGILIAYEDPFPRLRFLGLRDGNEDHLKNGVGGGLYHFSLQHLEGKGYRKAKLGWSRAFLRDGVLQYKKKWGQRIVGTSPDGFALGVLNQTPATRAFLRNNPFIFKSHDLLCGAVFVDTGSPLLWRELQQVDREYFHSGLSRLFIYHLQRGNASEKGTVPPDLSQRIVLRSESDIAL